MMDGGSRSKLSFVTWVPDSMDLGSFKKTIKAKQLSVMYAGMLKKEMPAVVCFLQANDLDDVSANELLHRVSKFEKSPVDINAGFRS